MPVPPLFDQLCFGLYSKLEGLRPGARTRMVEDFRRRGWLERVDGGRVALSIPSPTASADRLEASLFLRERVEEDGTATVTITSGSKLHLNGMRLLRAELGEAASGPVGLDGQDNVVGPTAGRSQELQAVQLGLVRDLVDALRAAIDGHLPGEAGASEQELWLRAAELTIDAAHPSARSFVYGLARAALPGASRVVLDGYRVSAEGGVAPVVRWFERADGSCGKVYPKHDGLLRVELEFKKRAGLEHMGTGKREVGGPEAVELLAELAALASPRFLTLLAHVESARAGVRPLQCLVDELAPLLALALGRRGGRGRPAQAEAVEGAGEAFQALLTVGAFCRRGLPRNSALRAVLDGLSTERGPLVRAGGNAWSVRPLGAATPRGMEAWEEAVPQRRSAAQPRRRRPIGGAPGLAGGAGGIQTQVA